jgi:hypothetical protein
VRVRGGVRGGGGGWWAGEGKGEGEGEGEGKGKGDGNCECNCGSLTPRRACCLGGVAVGWLVWSVRGVGEQR